MTQPLITDQLDKALGEITTSLQNAVTEYGPDAVSLALAAFRIEALQQIITGFFLLALVIAIVRGEIKFWKFLDGLKDGDDEGVYFAQVASTVISIVATVFCSIATFNRLFDVSAWAAVFGYPELRIAMRALAAAGLM